MFVFYEGEVVIPTVEFIIAEAARLNEKQFWNEFDNMLKKAVFVL